MARLTSITQVRGSILLEKVTNMNTYSYLVLIFSAELTYDGIYLQMDTDYFEIEGTSKRKKDDDEEK